MTKLGLSLAILAGLDIGTSIFGLTHGHPEAAPGMAAIVYWFGPLAVAPMKMWLTVLILELIALVKDKPRQPAVAIAIVLFAIPVVNNIWLLV